MFSKQLTSKLKEEKENANTGSEQNAKMNVAQCDRIIRTVSCKHETNHSIKKSNINVLQTFDDIKLYIAPKNYKQTSNNTKNITAAVLAPSSTNEEQQQDSKVENASSSNASPVPPASPTTMSYPNSTKLPRRNESIRNTTNANNNATTNDSSETSEVDLKEILDQISDTISCTHLSEWFRFSNMNNNNQKQQQEDGATRPDSPSSIGDVLSTPRINLFDSIHQALNYIDFNLKRNSDFINELTKLLDTSRAIKQEAHLKKVLKLLEEEKIQINKPQQHQMTLSMSQPASPKLSKQTNKNDDELNEETTNEFSKKTRTKYKSFKGFTSSFSTSPKCKQKNASNTPATNADVSNTTTTTITTKQNYLTMPANASFKSQSNKDLSTTCANNIEVNFQRQLLLYNQHNEVNNSDYIELELEIEKISYHLDKLLRGWSKIKAFSSMSTNDSYQQQQLKQTVEFHSLLNNLNSSVVLNDLEQTMFKLNWLITSKSGFSEPNWHTNVISLTPSTLDSFIGINLLKNYYRYVKYDFVSYKLFTRQLQLIQICAILLTIVHRVLIFYKESITMASISNNFTNTSNQALIGDSTMLPNQSSLVSFSFSADKYRPISWSANHVTLYNIQNTKQPTAPPSPLLNHHQQPPTSPIIQQNGHNISGIDPIPLSSSASSRASSMRRHNQNRFLTSSQAASNTANTTSKEDNMRQIKSSLFQDDLNEFLTIAANRLNIQATLANRTGYFYMVNQSTGLVMQAVDFASSHSLKEQIEQNQKRLQNSSIKMSAANKATVSGGGAISKGPRFYLMPRATSSSNKPNKNNSSLVSTSSSLLSDTANDEQLWYYYLINGCIANKIIRSGHCMAASSLNTKSPVCFWPNVKTTNCSWFYNSNEQTIVSGLSDDLVLDYIIIDEAPNQRYAVVIDTRVPNKASQKWSFEFC